MRLCSGAMSIRQTVLDEIAAWCRKAGIAESTLGSRAVNDPNFVSRLRHENVTIARIERVRQYMYDHPPGAA